MAKTLSTDIIAMQIFYSKLQVVKECNYLEFMEKFQGILARNQITNAILGITILTSSAA